MFTLLNNIKNIPSFPKCTLISSFFFFFRVKFISKNSNEAARGYQRASEKLHKWRGKKKKKEEEGKERKGEGGKEESCSFTRYSSQDQAWFITISISLTTQTIKTRQPCLLLSARKYSRASLIGPANNVVVSTTLDNEKIYPRY